jgi:hypothetical protein
MLSINNNTNTIKGTHVTHGNVKFSHLKYSPLPWKESNKKIFKFEIKN